MLHVDFRVPGSTDYTTLLRATRLLTRDERYSMCCSTTAMIIRRTSPGAWVKTGEGDAVDRGHLPRLASEGGVPLKTAEATIARMLEQAETFAQRAAAFPIRRATAQQMKILVEACRKRLAEN